MTTEIEKTFFDTFGIEPRKVKICRNVNHCPKKYKLCNDNCKHWQVIRTDYSQINDSIYLQLVAILNVNTSKRLYVADVEDLKTQTLKGLISCHSEMGAVVGGCDFKEAQDILVEQVQALFKEG